MASFIWNFFHCPDLVLSYCSDGTRPFWISHSVSLVGVSMSSDLTLTSSSGRLLPVRLSLEALGTTHSPGNSFALANGSTALTAADKSDAVGDAAAASLALDGFATCFVLDALTSWAAPDPADPD